jgi:hypothetical protein
MHIYICMYVCMYKYVLICTFVLAKQVNWVQTSSFFFSDGDVERLYERSYADVCRRYADVC